MAQPLYSDIWWVWTDDHHERKLLFPWRISAFLSPCIIVVVLSGSISSPFPVAVQSFSASTASTTTTTSRRKTQNSQNDVSITNTQAQQQQKDVPTCQYCSTSFASRNALFRHLKENPSCSADQDTSTSETSTKEDLRWSLILPIAYHHDDEDDDLLFSDNQIPEKNESTSVKAPDDIGRLVQDAIEKSLVDLLESNTTRIILSSTTTKRTQSSVAKQRHRSLAQESGISSAGGDVLALHLRLLLVSKRSTTTTTTTTICTTEFVKNLADMANSYLYYCRSHDITTTNTTTTTTTTTFTAPNKNNYGGWSIRILNGVAASSSSSFTSSRSSPIASFHAERDCTQRIYHYLLPISWLLLFPSTASSQEEKEQQLDFTLESWCLQLQQQRNTPPPPPQLCDALQRLRQALRCAESRTIPNRKVRRRQQQPSSKDDGQQQTKADHSSIQQHQQQRQHQKHRRGNVFFIGTKERKPWHNFAHKELRGDASPNQEPVWCILDKARMVGFCSSCASDDDKCNDTPAAVEQVAAILEFKGDQFVQGQIASIVGTAIAMTHGWLPSNTTFSTALSENVFLETPSAPSRGYLYNAGARFHYHEKDLECCWNNSSSSSSTTAAAAARRWLQEKLLLRRLSILDAEKQWIWDLQHVVTPRIRLAMQQAEQQPQQQDTNRAPTTTQTMEDTVLANNTERGDHDALLQAYKRTLRLLRDIVASNSWPETSMARSRVIQTDLRRRRRRSNPTTNSEEKETAQGQQQVAGAAAGSFTVFNTQIPPGEGGNYLIRPGKLKDLPIGNTAFPELVKAVFDLEKALSQCDTAVLRRANTDGTLQEPSIDNNDNNNNNVMVRPASLCCAINCNAQFRPHVDSGRGNGQSLSMIVGLGDYCCNGGGGGGELVVEGVAHDIRYRPLEFDGWSSRHWTNPFKEGNGQERFTLVWFSPAKNKRQPRNHHM
eukprot:scaffold12118_cov138-Cylindrotheca_fusiformis.AAC.12